jgi:uncharacterized protein YkwD
VVAPPGSERTASSEEPAVFQLEFSVPAAPTYVSDEGGDGPFAVDLERRFPGLRHSPRLTRAAEQCARLPARLGLSVLPAELIEAAVAWAGCPDLSPHGLAVLTTEEREDDVWEAVTRVLAQRGATYTHAGVARVPVEHSRFRWSWVALFVGRKVNLQPLARQPASGGALPVVFSLLPGYRDAKVVTTWPDGSVRQASVQEKQGLWRASVPISPGEGEQQLEILASSRQGPEVIALMPLSVGVSPRRSWSGSLDCSETSALTTERAERAIFELINDERRKRGLAAYQLDIELAAVARAHSKEMAETGTFAHILPLTGELGDRLRAAGIVVAAAAENLGKGECLTSVHRSLMESPGHRANLLSLAYTHVGVGVALGVSASGNLLYMVTEDFARPRVDAKQLP